MSSTIELRMKIVDINSARQALKGLTDDGKAFKKALQDAGVPLRDQKLLLTQINKEMNDQRRNALGITAALGQAAAKAKAYDAALKGVAAGAAAAVARAKEMANIKPDAAIQQGADDLQESLFNARKSMGLTKEAWAKIGGDNLIVEAANQAGYSAKKLADELKDVQDELSVGEDLMANQGELLKTMVKDAQVMHTSFKDITRLQTQAANQFDIKDAGGKKNFVSSMYQQGMQGSLSPEDAPAFIASMSSYVRGTGQKGVPGANMFFALNNAVKDIQGLSARETATRAGRFFAAMAAPKTTKMLAKTVGHDVFDKQGHYDPVKIADELGAYQDKVGDRAFNERMSKIFPNQNGRYFMQGLIDNRRKLKGTPKDVLALANPDIAAGDAAIDRYAGEVLELNKSKDQISKNKQDLGRFQVGRPEAPHKFGDWWNELKSRTPWLEAGADAAEAAWDKGGKTLAPIAGYAYRQSLAQAAKALGSAGLRGVPGVGAAATLLTPSDTAGSSAAGIPRDAAAKAKQAESDRLWLQKQGLAPAPVVNVNVTVQEGMQAAVTSQVTSSRDKARGTGSRPATLPGR